MNMYTQPMLQENALKDKVAIVTGGGSGLGKAMTKYFLQLGAKVVITSRNLEKLQGTAAELEAETGGKVLCVSCDVRNWDEVEAMKEAIKNPTEDTIFELSSIVEANAFKAGARSCLKMFHSLLIEG